MDDKKEKTEWTTGKIKKKLGAKERKKAGQYKGLKYEKEQERKKRGIKKQNKGMGRKGKERGKKKEKKGIGKEMN